MKWGNWSLVLIMFCLLGSVALPRYVPGAIRPDCLIILMVFVAVRARGKRALGVCWTLGLVRDMLSGGPLGGYALLYLIAGLAVLRVRATVNLRPVPAQAPVGFLAALAIELAYLAIGSFRSGIWPPAGAVRVLFTASLATGVLIAACAWLLDRLLIRKRHRFVYG